jgi:hypothetical protein
VQAREWRFLPADKSGGFRAGNLVNTQGEAAMDKGAVDQTVFFMAIRSLEQTRSAQLLIDSIRSFGGPLGYCPIWIFSQGVSCENLKGTDVQVFPLAVPETVGHYLYAFKVYACSRAEEVATPSVRSLVWLSTECLIVQPPLLFDLGQAFDAAVRSVHIKNVGLLATEPLDDFWENVYQTVGVPDVQTMVESFIDAQHIRAYFNSHIFSANPSMGLFRRWFECFETLVADQAFQLTACQDERHQIFLHQAILSALIATSLNPERIRMLPPDYVYPYNLHQSVPPDRRAVVLNDLVCIAYDDRSLDPDKVDDIEIHEPLSAWLVSHRAAS